MKSDKKKHRPAWPSLLFATMGLVYILTTLFWGRLSTDDDRLVAIAGEHYHITGWFLCVVMPISIIFTAILYLAFDHWLDVRLVMVHFAASIPGFVVSLYVLCAMLEFHSEQIFGCFFRDLEPPAIHLNVLVLAVPLLYAAGEIAFFVNVGRAIRQLIRTSTARFT